MTRVPAEYWKPAGRWLLRMVAAVLIIGTLLSITDLNQWWIRIWDFPRLQILIAMALVAGALWFLDRHWGRWLNVILAGLILWQLYRVYPYTRFAPVEVGQTLPDETYGDGCFTVLVLNVLQTNRDYRRTQDLIRSADPDIVLLMETDPAWTNALASVLDEYPGRIDRPLDNTYGIMLATRLPMREATIQDLAQADTPSVFATLSVGRSEFRLIAVHPRPPRPKQDTEERDAEIVVAARHAGDLEMPVLAIGDFNDVAWSDTTKLFKDIGSFLDPRIGRGTYATFPADMVWLGWPLDHVFVTEEFLLESLSVGGRVGSDHRPIITRLCLDPAAARGRNENPERPSSEDEEEAQEVIREFEEDR
jgi:endonuclease/exonuclease/phosphatase (EEP) superfamily protein YafD